MVVYLTIVDFAQSLRTRTNNLALAAVEVEHVRTGVDLSQTPVRVEGVEVGGASQTLRRDGLDDVPCDDALLEVSDETLVSGLPNIRDCFVSKPNGGLRKLRGDRAKDNLG